MGGFKESHGRIGIECAEVGGEWRMIFKFQIDIKAPIEAVFAWLDDDESLKSWIEELEETKYTSEVNHENPVGATFTQKIKEGRRVVTYEGEVTAYDKPRQLGVKLWDKDFSVDVDYRLTPLNGETRLEYTADLHFHTIFSRIMGVLFWWLSRRIIRKQITKLKDIAEQGPAKTRDAG